MKEKALRKLEEAVKMRSPLCGESQHFNRGSLAYLNSSAGYSYMLRLL